MHTNTLSLTSLMPHSYASSTSIFPRTSQYLVSCVQIFGIQPSPPRNSRSTATSWHILTPLSTLRRLVQYSNSVCTTKQHPTIFSISLARASSKASCESYYCVKQQPKFSHITSQHRSTVQVTQHQYLAHPPDNKLKYTNPPHVSSIPLADECSSPSRRLVAGSQ